MVTRTRTHVKIGFVNPFLICDECGGSVPYWHDPARCSCDGKVFNYPCEHEAGITSKCPTWSPVDSCTCKDKNQHDRSI